MNIIYKNHPKIGSGYIIVFSRISYYMNLKMRINDIWIKNFKFSKKMDFRGVVVKTQVVESKLTTWQGFEAATRRKITE